MYKVKDADGLAVRGLLYDERDVNKLKMFPNEILKHYVAKAILFHILRRKLKHDVISEFVVTGCGVGDLLDLSARVQYEIEFNTHKYIREGKAEKYKNRGIEVIVVHCNKMPMDIKKAVKYLERYLVYEPVPMKLGTDYMKKV